MRVMLVKIAQRSPAAPLSMQMHAHNIRNAGQVKGV